MTLISVGVKHANMHSKNILFCDTHFLLYLRLYIASCYISVHYICSSRISKDTACIIYFFLHCGYEVPCKCHCKYPTVHCNTALSKFLHSFYLCYEDGFQRDFWIFFHGNPFSVVVIVITNCSSMQAPRCPNTTFRLTTC